MEIAHHFGFNFSIKISNFDKKSKRIMFNSFKAKGYPTKACQEAAKYYDSEPSLAYSYARSAFLQENSDLDAIETLATILFNYKDFETVVELCQRWFEYDRYADDEKSGRINFMRAKSYYYTYQYDKVEEDLNKALKIFKDKGKEDKVNEIEQFVKLAQSTQNGPQVLS